MEGDQTSDPAVLLRMLHRVWEEGDDIVLASCYLYGGGIRGTNLHRIGLSHIANGLMKKALGLSGLATLSSFYRVYQVSALQAMHARWGDGFISTRGFECMVEVLYRAAQLRLPDLGGADGPRRRAPRRQEQDARAAHVPGLPAPRRPRRFRTAVTAALR